MGNPNGIGLRCQNVSAASGNPKKAFRLMPEIEKKSYKELGNEEGMDVLWANLRTLLRPTFMGQFLQEKELEGRKLLLGGRMMNGRQLCWLLRE